MNIISIPCNISNYGTTRSLNNIKYLVIHYTANAGDTAIGNGNYFKNNYTGTSAHYFVDETNIVQSVQDTREAWHCGANVYYHKECRNTNSIGIEMCSERDINGKYYFNEATISRAAEFARSLMDKYNIGIDNVIRHYDVTHKNCPAPFAEKVMDWYKFKDRLLVNTKEDDEVIETRYMNIDGKTIKVDEILKDDTTFVKLRGLEAAGYNVGYNANTKIATLNKNIDKLSLVVDGKEEEVSAINVNDTNYVKLRDIVQLTGDTDIRYNDNKVYLDHRSDEKTNNISTKV